MAQLVSQFSLSLKNILVATDFSAPSLSALTCVVPIARESDSVIHVLNVIQFPQIAVTSPEVEENMRLEIRLDAQRQLGALEVLVETVPHRMWLREGNVWASIEDLVRSEHIDLITVGTSRESQFKKFFVGSVAEEVIRKAICPVLSVGPHASPDAHEAPLAQLLYVTNLWEKSHGGLQYAVQLAMRYNSRLLLLHVVEQEEPKQSDHEWLSAYRRIMRNLLPENAKNLREEPVLRVEVAKNITARILQVACEVKADLVVMDVRPEKTWASHLRDKVYAIICGASCPVLTVRTNKPEVDESQA